MIKFVCVFSFLHNIGTYCEVKFGQLKRDIYVFDTLIAKEDDLISSFLRSGDCLLLER